MEKLLTAFGGIVCIVIWAVIVYTLIRVLEAVLKIPRLLMDLDETLRGISAKQDRILILMNRARQEEEQSEK